MEHKSTRESKEIGSNSLPTKENLMLRLGSNDNLLPLCESAMEMCTYLFFKCSVARAIWIASRYCLKSNNAPGKFMGRYHQSGDRTFKTW